MDFGRMLKTLRVSAGIGLRELSRTIDVSPTYLSLVENGKQAPPNAARIAQIEKALKVPIGCLNSLTSGLATDTVMYVEEVPESVDFLEVAKRNSMKSADFMELTGFLNTYGWEAMKQMLEYARSEDIDFCSEVRNGAVSGPYVWPFLREELFFDVVEPMDKNDFLNDVVSRIAERTDEFDKEAVLARLLEREKATSTGIGDGVAVPHAYLAELDKMIVAFARIPQGLDFDAIDGMPVHMVFLLVGPPSAENLHLRLLARFAKLLSYKSVRNRLRDAPEPGEIISTFKAAELGIP